MKGKLPPETIFIFTTLDVPSDSGTNLLVLYCPVRGSWVCVVMLQQVTIVTTGSTVSMAVRGGMEQQETL